MTDSQPDPVTAYLAEVQERPVWITADVPRLLAAVEKVRELADSWEQQAAGMERAADLDDPEIWNEHARELREAISRELLGEGE